MGYGNRKDLERRFYVSKGSFGLDDYGNKIDYIEGTFKAIYFYNDPGKPAAGVRPGIKLCVELMEHDAERGIDTRYTIAGRYNGADGAATWYATTLMDGLQHVAPGERVRISVRAGGDVDKITFAKVEVQDGKLWKSERSENKWGEIEPSERGDMIDTIIRNHDGFVENPEETPADVDEKDFD